MLKIVFSGRPIFLEVLKVRFPPIAGYKVVTLEGLEVCVFSSKKTRRFSMIWCDLYMIVFSRLSLISTQRCVLFVRDDKGLVYVLPKSY